MVIKDARARSRMQVQHLITLEPRNLSPVVAICFNSPGLLALPTPTVISTSPAFLALAAAFRAAVPGFFFGLRFVWVRLVCMAQHVLVIESTICCSEYVMSPCAGARFICGSE